MASVNHASTGDDFDGLLDWPRLQEWVAGQDLPGTGPLTGATELLGGSPEQDLPVGARRRQLRAAPPAAAPARE